MMESKYERMYVKQYQSTDTFGTDSICCGLARVSGIELLGR
jgi:hypothetical protein